MHTKTWIIAAFMLLGLTGGMILWQIRGGSPKRSTVNQAHDSGRSEELEIPIRTSFAPECWRPTSWNRLDEAGTNRRCNQDAISQWQNETPCAASPIDPDIAVVGANDFVTGSVMAGYYRTSDGGNSWHHAFYGTGPISSSCSFAGDPSIAADATGKFYAVYCTYDCSAGQGVYCQTSTDNGVSWSNPIAVGITGGAFVDIDKPHTACDYNLSSPYVNHCYAVWMHIMDHTRTYFSRSTNGGASFTTPVRISTHNSCWCPAITVGPEGQVYSVWIATEMGGVYFDRSLNGGATWNDDVRVATFTGNVWPSNPCGYFRTTHYPAIGCDVSNSAYRGSVYICWDMEHGSDNGNIYVCRSTDGGVTWSDTMRVNDDATTRMQWWSWIAVHPRTGDIGISWLDRRMDPNNCSYAVYGAISTNGGTTWSPNFRISDAVLNPANSDFLGDYTGATFSNLGFLSSWADPRNDDCDAYAAWWNNGDQLAIQYPNGGETWTTQEACSVTWTYRYAPDTLDIELNRDYPNGTWEWLGSAPSTAGQWVGAIAGTWSAASRIRIMGNNIPTVGDTSDGNFSIGLIVRGVVASRIGNDIRIGWQNANSAYYRIYSSSTCCDTFPTWEGSTSDTVFMDSGAVFEPVKFYIVKASTRP